MRFLSLVSALFASWLARMMAVGLLSLIALPAIGQSTVVPTIYLADSPVANDLFRQAKQLDGQSRYVEAVLVYQQIIDDHGSKLVPQASGSYMDARHKVNRQIIASPKLLAAYHKTYEVGAVRLLEDAVDGKGNSSQAEHVIDRFWLCKAGLDAAFYIAATSLEKARPETAISVLDEASTHPLLNQYKTRWHGLQAAAGLFANQTDRYQTHLQVLNTPQGAAVANRLKKWAANLRRPVDDNTLSSSNTPQPVSIPDSLAAPLWEASLKTSPTQIALLAASKRAGRRSQVKRFTPDAFPAQPVAIDEHLYVNDTGTVFSFDLSSGRVHWSYTSSMFDDPVLMNRINRQVRQSSVDRRGIWVYQDHLVTVLGYTQRGYRQKSAGTARASLVCLDRNHGELNWEIQPSDIDASLSAASFYGSPVGRHDRVYVLLNRSQTSGFMATYMAAIDVTSGQVLWYRHLWSRTAHGMYGHGTTSAVLSQSSLYVTDGSGAAARLRIRDGAVQWLRKLELPQVPAPGRKQQNYIRTRLSSAPIVTQAGLVIHTHNKQAPVVVIDPVSGQVTDRLDSDALSECYYFTPSPRGVLAVGPTVQLLDNRSLKPVWTREFEAPLLAHSHSRAAVTADKILLPAKQHLVLLNQNNGKTISVTSLDSTGNILALQDQVIVAGTTYIRSYQAWDRAYAHLAKQISTNPSDPMPALALAHVALASDKRLVALRAVDRAIDALANQPIDPLDRLETTDQLQRRVFNQVLRFTDDSNRAIDSDIRLQLFERLAALAHHQADRVAYHLAFGDHLLDADQVQQAIDQYQSILVNRDLAIQTFDRGDGPLSAEFEARKRLSQLVTRYGPKVYARYETIAAQQLVEFKLQAPVDPSSLIRLARQYPLSRSSLIATVAAAEAMAKRGNYQAATAQLHRVYRKTDEAGLIQRVVGRLAEIYQKTGDPKRASSFLLRAKQDHKTLRPLRDGKPVAISPWVDELEAIQQLQKVHAPYLGMLSGESFKIDERLLVPSQPISRAKPNNYILTINGFTLRLRSGRDLSEQWRFKLPNRQVDLISASSDQVLLRCGIPGVILAIDKESGKPSWPAVSVQDMLTIHGHAEPAPSMDQLANAKIYRQANIKPVPPPGAHARIRANTSVVCVAGESGLLVALDRQTGELIWRLVSPIGAPKSIVLNEQVLVVNASGQHNPLTDGAILVVDAITGEPWHTPISGRRQIQWIGLGESDLMVYATQKKLVAYDLYSGQVRWWQTVNRTPTPIGGIVNEDLVMVRLRDQSGPIYLFDSTDGHIINRLVPASVKISNTFQYHQVGTKYHLMTEYRSISLDKSGSILWQDSIRLGGRDKIILQIAGQKYLYLVVTDQDHARIKNNKKLQRDKRQEAYEYKIYCHNRANGSLLKEYRVTLDHPIQNTQAIGVDGLLAFDTAGGTVVLPSILNATN